MKSTYRRRLIARLPRHRGLGNFPPGSTLAMWDEGVEHLRAARGAINQGNCAQAQRHLADVHDLFARVERRAAKKPHYATVRQRLDADYRTTLEALDRRCINPAPRLRDRLPAWVRRRLRD